MNYWLLSAGIGTALTALLHIFGGGREVLTPMIQAEFDVVAKRTHHVCWHMVTLDLVLSALALILLGAGAIHSSPWLSRFIALHFMGYGLLFVTIALATRVPQGLIRLGQWILFIPLAIVTWMGS